VIEFLSEMNRKIKTVIKLQLLTFILLVICFLVLIYDFLNKGAFLILAVLGLLFFALGVVLVFLSRKEKGRLKLFLLLAGFSAISPFLFSILHNLFYAMAMSFENLKFLFEILHVGSFIISLLIAPILFIFGIVGSILFLKSSKN